jgi:hypothetical protein
MTLQLESRILWGTGLENVLAFEYPTALDNKRHWRRPAPGSERARNAAGTTDAWVTGYDFMLAGRARWFTDALWSGGPGIQEFLDWAGQGNVFRFVPDKNAPDFYVDNVTLDDPFEDPAPDLEQADGSQAIDLVLRNPTVDFGQALRGVMFEYAPGASLTDPVAATFTRATAATRRGLPGTLVSPVGASDASGVLRDRHYEGSLRTTLLEAARTQLVTDPENFGNWTNDGTPVKTGGQADPFAGTAAYLLNDDDGAVRENIYQVVTFTGDATKAIALFVRQGTQATNVFGVFDNTAALWRHKVGITWTAGVPALTTNGGSGTRFTPENWGGGWWRVAVAVDGVVAANVNRFYILPTDDVAAQTGTLYTFGANAWNAAFPSSYQGPALASRSADSFAFPFIHKPQPMFFYAKFVERGTISLADSRILHLSSQEIAPRLLIWPNGGGVGYQLFYDSPIGSRTSSVTSSIPVYGETVELAGLLYPDGSVKLLQTRNGGAEVAGSQSGAGSFAAAWVGATPLHIGEGGGGTVQGFSAFARVKVGPLTFGGVTRDTIAKAQAV